MGLWPHPADGLEKYLGAFSWCTEKLFHTCVISFCSSTSEVHSGHELEMKIAA